MDGWTLDLDTAKAQGTDAPLAVHISPEACNTCPPVCQVTLAAGAGIAVVVMLFSGVWLYALLALGAYYLIVGNGFSRFVFASFTNGVFDRFINIHIEGVEVNRGLATEEEDDDDEEEDEEAIDAQ